MAATKTDRREIVDNDRRELIPRGGGGEKPRERPSMASRGDSQRAAPPLDIVDIASMDSFPCSDPPGYYQIS